MAVEFAPHALRGCRESIFSRRKPKRLSRLNIEERSLAAVSSGVRIAYSYLETNFDTRKTNNECE